MNTRRRQALQPRPAPSPSPTTAPVPSSRPTTPEHVNISFSSDSFPASSAASTIEITREELSLQQDPASAPSAQTGSPVRCSTRARQASIDGARPDARPLQRPIQENQRADPISATIPEAKSSRKRKIRSEDNFTHWTEWAPPPGQAGRLRTRSQARSLAHVDSHAEGATEETGSKQTRPPPAESIEESESKVDDGLEFVSPSLVIDGADAQTRNRPGSYRAASATGSPKKSTRGGGSGRGGRGGWHGNGGGRGRPRHRGRGGRGDSPEPPPRKRLLTEDDRLEISYLKARQQELKRFFSMVGAQQVEILDQISSRDLNKLVRKAKAHRLVPEFEALVGQLEARQEETCDMIRTRNQAQVEHEKQRMAQEREVIERQYLVSRPVPVTSSPWPLTMTDSLARGQKRTF